jgi:serine/threonine-protein kinase RsbW/sigma-B regulation protein RsbU (phosphoserine phosphatase)
MSEFRAEIRPLAAEIAALSERVGAFLEEAGLDAGAVHNVPMILEELLTNLGTHGGVTNDLAQVRVRIEERSVAAEIEDTGPEFDPRSSPDPDINAPLEERQIGGLGLFLARKLAERLDYVRRGGRNYTSFAVKRA